MANAYSVALNFGSEYAEAIAWPGAVGIDNGLANAGALAINARNGGPLVMTQVDLTEYEVSVVPSGVSAGAYASAEGLAGVNAGAIGIARPMMGVLPFLVAVWEHLMVFVTTLQPWTPQRFTPTQVECYPRIVRVGPRDHSLQRAGVTRVVLVVVVPLPAQIRLQLAVAASGLK